MKRTLFAALVFMAVCSVSGYAQTADSLGHTRIAPEHGLLERLSGRWNTTVRLWPSASDTHAVESIGKSESHMTLEGRFLIGQDSAHLQDKRYGDMAVMGFDNLKHRYVMTWADSRSTGLLNLSGTANDSGNVLTLQGDKDLPKGGKSKVKFVLRSFNGNFRALEIWETRSAGKERKVMEIVYTRAS